MKQKLILYYDKECPFCNRYAKFLVLKERYELYLCNARDSVENIRTQCPDLDINDGMIIEIEGRCLQGTEALAYLDRIITRSSLLAKLHQVWSLSPLVTRSLYNLIKVFRKVVLFLLRKKSTIK